MLPVMPALLNKTPVGVEPVTPAKSGTGFAAMLATEAGGGSAGLSALSGGAESEAGGDGELFEPGDVSALAAVVVQAQFIPLVQLASVGDSEVPGTEALAESEQAAAAGGEFFGQPGILTATVQLAPGGTNGGLKQNNDPETGTSASSAGVAESGLRPASRPGGLPTAQIFQPFGAAETLRSRLMPVEGGLPRPGSQGQDDQTIPFGAPRNAQLDGLLPGNPGAASRVITPPFSFEQLARPAAEELVTANRQEQAPAWTGFGSTFAAGSRPAPLADSLSFAPLYQARLSAGQIVDQVVSRVKLTGVGGTTSMSMTLHPKELGEVRVELVTDKDGVRAHLHAQNQQVLEALEKHLPRLREAFDAQGLKIQDLQVSCDARRDGNGAHQHGQGHLYRALTRVEGSTGGGEGNREWPAAQAVDATGWSNPHGFSLRV